MKSRQAHDASDLTPVKFSRTQEAHNLTPVKSPRRSSPLAVRSEVDFGETTVKSHQAHEASDLTPVKWPHNRTHVTNTGPRIIPLSPNGMFGVPDLEAMAAKQNP